MGTVTAAPEMVVEQVRIVRASRERIFAAWTDSEILKQWFGPATRHCPSAQIDARVGGTYRIDVHANPDVDAAVRESHATGVFTKIVPNRLLQFTWRSSWSPEDESLVTVTLRDVEDGTELTLRHERISQESCTGYANGWAGSLDKMAALLERA